MAKVNKNIIIQGLSGSLGDQIVIRVDKAGRTRVSVKPSFDPDYQFNEAQLEQQEQFRAAATYAKDAKTNEEYVTKAEGTPLTPYNVAVADWFHEPEIAAIDLSAWSGQIGQMIRIQATDDVKVTQVSVVITDENDTVLEQGQAVNDGGGWWEYVTTEAASGNPKVIATAYDLPGHIASMTSG